MLHDKSPFYVENHKQLENFLFIIARFRVPDTFNTPTIGELVPVTLCNLSIGELVPGIGA